MLWEDAPNGEKQQGYLRVLTADLKNTLAAIGAQDVLIRRRNYWAIQKNLIDCDYYRMKEGDVTAVNAYNGEFMAQYSWAEFTAGGLINFE